MSDPFVSVDEGMIENQGKANGRSFTRERWIEVLPCKTLAWLRQGRFQSTEISNPSPTTPPMNYRPVEFENLS